MGFRLDRLFILAVIFLGPISVYAQEDTTRLVLSSIAGQAIVPQEIRDTVFGKVIVRSVELPASFASIELVAQNDTLQESATQAGSFSFKKLKPGVVHMTVTYGNYEPFSESFELTPGENVVIVMFKKQTETLEAAVVKDEMPVVTQHGDTLIYHAGAVARREGDYAIDLLRQFPGVEVKDDQIIVTGKAVKRSYVNGALVFGLDPMASMEYLKGDEVVTMSVYDEDNPQDRIDGYVRAKQRVIDIKTKNPIFSSLDLQARAIAGADQQRQEDGSPQLRYTLGTNAHFFSELRQFQADVVTGNVGMRSSNINLVPGPLSSNVDNTDLRLGYSRFWQSSLYGNALQFSYSLENQKTKSRSHRLMEYFETAGTPERTEDIESTSTNMLQTHGIQASFNYRTGKNLTLSWNNGFHLSRNLADKKTLGTITVAGGNPMLQTQFSNADMNSWTLQENVTLGFISQDRKPLPQITIGLQLGRDHSDAWDLDTLASSYSKRYLTKVGNGLSQSYSARVSQNFLRKNQINPDTRETKTFQLSGEYSISYSSQERLQEAYDLYGTPSPLLNVPNTYNFTYSSLINSLQLSSAYLRNGSNTSFQMMFSLQGELERIIDKETIPSYNQEGKNYFRIRPLLNIGYNGWSMNYYSQAMAPSVEQLRRRINDTSPLSLIAGNPDLKQCFYHSFTLSWDPTNASRHAFSAHLNTRIDTHPIIYKTTFYASDTILTEYDNYKVKAGSTLMRWENTDYNFSFSTGFTESSQWGGKWRVSTRVTPSLSFQSRSQYFGDALDRTQEWRPHFVASATLYPLREVMLSFNPELSYIHAWNQTGSLDNHAIQGRLGVNMEASFLKRAFLSCLYSWDLYKDFTAPAMNNSVHRLNLSLGVGLLKDKALKIAISGVDLLRGGSQYNVVVGPSSISRTWTPVYGRYFIIDISYRFNNTSQSQGSNRSKIQR